MKYVLEGTVRGEGRETRVSVRLAEADQESVVWSDTFTIDSPSVEFEEKFVARVSAAVLGKLFPEAPGISLGQAACRDGWEAYRTGQMLANRGTMADLTKSLDYLRSASCPAAQAVLAETLIRLGKTGTPKSLSWEPAQAAAQAALDGDSRLPSAHIAMANVAFWKNWDWKTAEREFQSGLTLNPSDSAAHHDYAWLLMALGRKEEALASLNRAIALDPLSPRINMDAGWLLLQAGRFREAAAQAKRAMQLDPDLKEAHVCLSRALLYTGDDAAALDALRSSLTADRVGEIAGLPPHEAMRQLLRSSIRPKGSMDPYQRAWRLAWLGSREEALSELEDAYKNRSLVMPLVAVDPGYTSIRTDPRFQNLIRDMKL